MTHTFSKSAFYSFGDIPLAGPLPPIFSQLLTFGSGNRRVDFPSIVGSTVLWMPLILSGQGVGQWRPRPPEQKGRTTEVSSLGSSTIFVP